MYVFNLGGLCSLHIWHCVLTHCSYFVGVMPRRKAPKQMDTQSVQIASTVQTKRRKSNQSAVSSTTEQSSSTIDYEKLANEILRQQGKLQAQPTNCSDSHSLNPLPQENITVSPLPCTLQTNSPTGGQVQCAASEPRPQTAAEGTVSELVTRIFEGEPAGTEPNKTPTSNISITDGIPLGATVPSKIKSKIWSNEFIDLRSLLTHQEEDPVTLLITPGVINLQHSQKAKTPLSINQWTDAFLVFTCILLEQKPTEAPHLLKYMSFIRELQKLHGDSAWRAYDESFRKLRETIDLPWQKPVEELRGKSLAISSKQSYVQPFRGKQVGRISGVRFCFAYNQGNKCRTTPCLFTHICQTCRGPHPKIKCRSAEKFEHDKFSSNPSKGKQTK